MHECIPSSVVAKVMIVYDNISLIEKFAMQDVKVESEQEWTGLSAGEHLELIGQEGMLGAVLVGCCWLRWDSHAIHLCMKTADALWTALAKLLNLIRLDLDQLCTGLYEIAIKTTE